MTTPGHGLPAWVEELRRFYQERTGLMVQSQGAGPHTWVKWADLVAACPPQDRLVEEVNGQHS